jgi:hypothetical protein
MKQFEAGKTVTATVRSEQKTFRVGEYDGPPMITAA